MKDVVIKVENLSKRYRIGLKEQTKDTLFGAFGSILKSPFQNLKRLKKLTSFNENNNESDDIIWALKDISFEVKQGEVLGIIGANGAGKSTLLKILAQITHPTSGKVELHGRVASLLEVGTGFHPELSGRENIYLNGTILGMTKKEIDFKLDEIIEFSGVGKFIDTPAKRYSSGMRVRLAFSVAAHLDPEILLIDEVLAVGDAKFQKKCLGKMEGISNQGKTIIFVSHNMDAIQKLCKSCIFINQGSIERIGSTGKLISEYLNETLENEIISEFYNIEGPANNFVHFTKARIVSENGELIKTEVKDNSFIIEVSYDIFSADRLIIPSIDIYNNKGKYLFTSIHRRVDKVYNSIGENVAKITIPRNIFSNGYFSISFLFFSPSVTETERILQTNKIITFKIYDEVLAQIKSQADLNLPSSLIPEFEWKYD
jgi:lipopolysaccharide transport system ATP-binding protein